MFTAKRMVSSTGVMHINIISINDTVIEWLDADTFHLADLAKAIGIDREHEAKAKVTIEIVKGLCEVCGKNITTGDKLCDKCAKMICTECAKTDLTHILPNMQQTKKKTASYTSINPFFCNSYSPHPKCRKQNSARALRLFSIGNIIDSNGSSFAAFK